MKVLMWLSGSFDRRTPSEHLLTAIVESLYMRGHTVSIIQKDTGGNLPHLPEKIAKLGARSEYVKCEIAAKDNFIGRYLVDLKYVRGCREIIKKYKNCDAVFIQSSNIAGFMAGTIRRLLPGIPILLNVQDIFPENLLYTGKIKRPVYELMSAEQKYGYRRADKIITISDDMRIQLIRRGVPEEKVGVVYNWSYQDKPYEYVPNSEIEAMLPDSKFNVVYAGNIGVMQNVDLLIQSAKLMQEEKQIQFHIVGDGVYKEELVREARGLSNIRFWPMMPSDMAPDIYCRADVNIVPLAKNIYRTALPSKTATCIAAQKPIVFAIGRKSRFGRMIEKETGCVLTESDDPGSLCDAIIHFKQGRAVRGMADIFQKKFSRACNSMVYAKTLEELAEKELTDIRRR